MSIQTYLLDTNILIQLEDNHPVKPTFADFIKLASKYKCNVFVHECSREDIFRDKDIQRRAISLSKLEKFPSILKVRDLSLETLKHEFGSLPKSNDIVDATLLHAVNIGAVDFLVTEDRGLHERARRHSAGLSRRIMFVADAVQLLKTTYESVKIPIRYVEEVPAYTVSLNDDIFNSLRRDYQEFDKWWREKCVKEHRSCWIVCDNNIVGIVVRKDETASDTDASKEASKILKICTFKVRPENRGVKLGELLLKQVLWFSQKNQYDLVYLTTFPSQAALIDLLQYYGFIQTIVKKNGELIYEKCLSRSRLEADYEIGIFETNRSNYPRFVTRPGIEAFGVPIQESYHDSLFPDLLDQTNSLQLDLFAECPQRPGNTIRKVYLCRSPSNLGQSGSLLFFYKGKSKNPPSQTFTAIGIFEEFSLARSTQDLMRFTGGRSVYSEIELNKWNATKDKPVKVINFLLAGYIDPPVTFEELCKKNIIGGHPPQSIFKIKASDLEFLLQRLNLGFET